ncbi:MAG: ABC transporter permease, partial [Acidimicrobiales bacterium]
AAPLLSPHAPTDAGVAAAWAPPSRAHPFGADSLGRDVFSRVLHGARVSLSVGASVALAATALGVVVGVAAARGGRLADQLLMRTTDLFLALPLVVVVIVLARLPERQGWARALIGPPHSVRSVVVLITAVLWMPTARVVRSEVQTLGGRPFVEAARALGASELRIVARHILPNAAGPIAVNAVFNVVAGVLTETTLSFLGYGVDRVRTATWGGLLADAKGDMGVAPWLVWAPGGAVALTLLCVHLLGESLQRGHARAGSG